MSCSFLATAGKSYFLSFFCGLSPSCETNTTVAGLNTLSRLRGGDLRPTAGNHTQNAQHAQPARAHLLCSLDLSHKRRDLEAASIKYPAQRISSPNTPLHVAFTPLTLISTRPSSSLCPHRVLVLPTCRCVLVFCARACARARARARVLVCSLAGSVLLLVPVLARVLVLVYFCSCACVCS